MFHVVPCVDGLDATATTVELLLDGRAFLALSFALGHDVSIRWLGAQVSCRMHRWKMGGEMGDRTRGDDAGDGDEGDH